MAGHDDFSWRCASCGAPGVPEEGYTQLDPRYTQGRCTADKMSCSSGGTRHVPLVRAEVYKPVPERLKTKRVQRREMLAEQQEAKRSGRRVGGAE